MDFTQFVNSFISLLVLANPLSALPAILKITRHQTLAEKQRTGFVATAAILIIFLVATWIGIPLLMILGIKIAAFQVAGGVIIFMMAMSMLNAEESTIKQTPEEQKQRIGDTGAIVPLAIPIIAGPGAISTLIVQASEFPGIFNLLIISMAAILVSLAIGLLLYFSSALEKLLGQSKINIISRLGGLLLAAIAVQNLASGILGLFPALKG